LDVNVIIAFDVIVIIVMLGVAWLSSQLRHTRLQLGPRPNQAGLFSLLAMQACPLP
jgi:hypothetical protein